MHTKENINLHIFRERCMHVWYMEHISSYRQREREFADRMLTKRCEKSERVCMERLSFYFAMLSVDDTYIACAFFCFGFGFGFVFVFFKRMMNEYFLAYIHYLIGLVVVYTHTHTHVFVYSYYYLFLFSIFLFLISQF